MSTHDHSPAGQGNGIGEKKGLSRRQLLVRGAVAGAAAAVPAAGLAKAERAQASGSEAAPAPSTADPGSDAIALVNGKIHTMDGSNRVVSKALISKGRFVQVGDELSPCGSVRTIDLKGRTVLPGLIDNHDHIVLVGNRPGWHVCAEDVFTHDALIERYRSHVDAASSAGAGFITTIGPIAAMQFPGNTLPTRAQLSAVPFPVYILAAQGGNRTNDAGAAWFQARGLTVAANGSVSGNALLLLRQNFLTPESRKRTTRDALAYYAGLGLTLHLDEGAFQSDTPSNGIANENNYTMHNPFIALNDEGELPARMRINFLHTDSVNPFAPSTDPTFRTMRERVENAFPFFGDDWLRTGGIGEFTGGGVAGYQFLAQEGWRAENHSVIPPDHEAIITQWEAADAVTSIKELRWVLSHVPGITIVDIERMKRLGAGVAVGWGPTRTGTNVGPPYRTILDSGIHVGYHSDGGDITVINPWLNFYTMMTGRNLAGAHILGDQVLTRRETLWLATAANKWFIREEDVGSIEVGSHADLAVLDGDYFTVPDEELKRMRSVLTVVGGKVVHNGGVL